MKHYKDSENNLYGFDENQNVPSGLTEISMDEVNTINQAKDDATFNALAYDKKRIREYPDIGDQLDMIWHLIDSGGTLDKTSDFYTSIKVVKDAHPKS